MQAIEKDFKEKLDYVFRSSEGILIEIDNQSIADELKSEEGSGAITIALDIKIKGLEFNAELEQNAYNEELEEKQEKEGLE